MNQTEVQTNQDNEPKPWPFRERWRIRGCLVAESPLFIGSGEISHRDTLKNGKQPIDIADCLRDHWGKPVIPATSLKGVMRASLGNLPKDQIINRLFGEDSEKEASGRGGEAEFLDALLALPPKGDTPLPHWDETRQTWVEIINAIDRERGTVAENHLAHRETVAPGSGFAVVITGQFSKPDEDIPLLLAMLETFNRAENPIMLGADTASGKGRMRWELEAVERIDAAAALAWLDSDDQGMAADAFCPVPNEKLKTLREKASELQLNGSGGRSFDITLKFDGPFLVNNPLTKAQVDAEKQLPQQQRSPDARPRTNEQGEVILPAKSFRGVLRSQGEKILRTMLDLNDEQWQNKAIQKWVEKHIACRPEIANRACKPIKKKDDVEKLCLACQLFGAPGWRSPLELTDFSLIPGNYEIHTQEFVAIDRFTGGGKDSAKFNARAILYPQFTGRLHLDESRLPANWAHGLLALLLRDLKEGEMRFGWGAASKGYGWCTADISQWDDENWRKDAKEALKALRNNIETIRKKHIDNANETPEASHD